MANENKKAKAEGEKVSVINRAKDGIAKGFNEVKDFTKRNGKKILTGVGVGAGVVVSAVLIDKLNIDPTAWFKRKDSAEGEEPVEIETSDVTEE